MRNYTEEKSFFIQQFYTIMVQILIQKRKVMSQLPESKTVINFDRQEEINNWYAIDDRIMGGISQSLFQPESENTAAFAGKVSLENNGGFASVRREAEKFDLSAFDGVMLRVRGDGKEYNVNLKTDPRISGVYFQAAFSPPAGDWITVKLPFLVFRAKIRGRYVDDRYTLDPADICSFGFMISDKQKGQFRLLVEKISAYRG